MRNHLTLGAILLASASVATSAQGAINLVTNGSFELGIDPAGQTQVATGNDTSVTGWTVLSSGINYADNTAWDAADGSRSVELHGEGTNGGVFQRLYGFTEGYSYELSFVVSANPFDPDPRPKPERVFYSITGGGPQQYNFTLNAENTASNMLYQTVTHRFVASRTFQDLQFRSGITGAYGAVIDSVSVTVVPEASTWLMLVAGFGLVGAAARRRSRGAVAA